MPRPTITNVEMVEQAVDLAIANGMNVAQTAELVFYLVQLADAISLARHERRVVGTAHYSAAKH